MTDAQDTFQTLKAQAAQEHGRMNWPVAHTAEKSFSAGADWGYERGMEANFEVEVEQEVTAICTSVRASMGWSYEKAKLWCETENPLFGGTTPLKLITLGRARKVWAFILDANESNFYERGRLAGLEEAAEACSKYDCSSWAYAYTESNEHFAELIRALAAQSRKEGV